MSAVLEVENLKKTYKKSLAATPVQALKGISFSIQPGTITGFLGANGAGKTTTIKCILELAFPNHGKMRYFGKEGLTAEAKSRIGFLPERPYFYDYLTGREFLRFYGELSTDYHGAQLKLRIDQLLERVGLTHASDRALRSYSKGMLQRIGIAQTLIHEPEFIILDEPMTGLDPDGRFEVREIISETAKQGTAVFFSSHLLPDAEQLCERLVILKQGQLIFEGKTGDLIGKVEKGYRIFSTLAGANLQEDAASLGELQLSLDRIRKSGAQISEVRPLRATLEEAFVKIAFDRTNMEGAR
jgi:ABC-2 type transport system ATP-binding protein